MIEEKREVKFNGEKYLIPIYELQKLEEFIKTTWTPNIPTNTPSNTKALSFTLFLRDWFRDNFSKYREARP